MLMLTHTCLLQQMMSASGIDDVDPDIYIYNIAPDLLTIHPDIDSRQTHSIPRFIKAPPDHQRTAYVMYHLLVDDLAHYGSISMTCQEGFDPNSSGYTYLKGRNLVGPIKNLHKMLGKELSFSDAAYQSHLLVEMVYDLVIRQRIDQSGSIDLLEEAVHFTFDGREKEFCSDISWLYGIDPDRSREVLKIAVSYITRERMQRFMNIEGRIRLFTDKFGLRNNNELFTEAISELFQDALLSIGDENFLQEACGTIRNCGWLPTR